MSNITAKQLASYITNTIKPFPLPILIMFITAIIWAVDLSLRPYLLGVIFDGLASSKQHNIFTYLAGPIILYLGSYFLQQQQFSVALPYLDISISLSSGNNNNNNNNNKNNNAQLYLTRSEVYSKLKQQRLLLLLMLLLL